MEIAHADLKCGECGADMVLRFSKFGKFYGCTRYPDCRGTHGAHPDGKPFGTPANKETKAARIRAHRAFDSIWISRRDQLGIPKSWARRDAYSWLAVELEMKVDDCHIGMFDVETCERIVALCEARMVAPEEVS